MSAIGNKLKEQCQKRAKQLGIRDFLPDEPTLVGWGLTSRTFHKYLDQKKDIPISHAHKLASWLGCSWQLIYPQSEFEVKIS